NMSARVVCKLKAFKLRQAACTIGKVSLTSADHSIEGGELRSASAELPKRAPKRVNVPSWVNV
ncbi:MAG: hypothetical protein ACTS5A_03525, partial [Candidatus Hodgkinia cicadicola]